MKKKNRYRKDVEQLITQAKFGLFDEDTYFDGSLDGVQLKLPIIQDIEILNNNGTINYKNPLYGRHDVDPENPILEFLDFMHRPENFYFTCKWLFNIHLHPFQCVMLEELWIRKFPMLIAARGASKTWILSLYAVLRALFTPGCKIVVVGAAFRQSKLLFEYMEGFWRQSPILRSMVGSGKGQGPKRDIDRCNFYIGDSEITAIPLGDGCVHTSTFVLGKSGFSIIKNPHNNVWGNGKFRLSDDHLDNGIKPTKIVTTKRGFYFEGTYNHKMKVCRDGEIQWVRADEMVVGDKILIDRSERWHDGNFDCSEDEAYILGSFIGDGSWTNKYKLRFTTNDEEHFLPYLNKYFDKSWVKHDNYHFDLNSISIIRDWINFWKLKPECRTINKTLPQTILSAPQSCMTACIQGLMDSDGHCQIYTKKGGTAITIGFTNTSRRLVEQLQFILLHYGIVATVSSRQRENKNWNRVYELLITGQDAVKFGEKIGFRLPRKQNILQVALADKKRTTSSMDTIPDVRTDMIRIAKNNRMSKDGLDHVVASKIASRKRITHDYANDFIKKYDNIEDQFISKLKILANPSIYYDEIISIEDGEAHTYDIHVPDGNEYCANGFFSHNSKIRGLRANYILADEFHSINQEIFEVVIRGFGSVSNRPDKKIESKARIKVLKALGYYSDAETVEEGMGFGNQTVISGTAYYSFDHFYDYWLKYKSIIENAANPKKINDMFFGEIPDGFDPKHYGIIRIPVGLLPDGFMDAPQISQAKVTMHSSLYNMEYEAVFADDSDGFLKRSLIESCVTKKAISTLDGEVQFNARVVGEPRPIYIYGIDPASESDNFAIIILEVYPHHRRIVYGWTINREKLQKRIKSGSANVDQSFYNYCARKIRNLLHTFPTNHIGMDAQGGGISIMEALHDTDLIEKDEHLIWTYIKQGDDDPLWWEEKEKPTDGQPGLHILHMVQFANADFTYEANHGLRKDFESKITLFPFFDSVEIEQAIHMDKLASREFDTLEDCVLEIEDLKDELSTIEHTQTPSGRDKWDTPQIAAPGGKKKRLRKDRYSALCIANQIARCIDTALQRPKYVAKGGYVGQKFEPANKTGKLYTGPTHITRKLIGGVSVRKFGV